MTVKDVREAPIQSGEFGWKEFEIYCEGHNIGIHPELWQPWWSIWKSAYRLGKSKGLDLAAEIEAGADLCGYVRVV